VSNAVDPPVTDRARTAIRPFLARLAVAVLACTGIAISVQHLLDTREGVTTRDARVGRTPVTIHAPEEGTPAPVVVVAHGFSGSRPLMKPFATTLARNGYVAVSYDALGHGLNPVPLSGDVTREDGATHKLLEELGRVIAFAAALPEAGEGMALLGHSMAADIVVRGALEHDAVDATVAVSMFSPAPTAEAPRNLLVVVGDWEGALKDEARRVLRLAAGEEAFAGQTYDNLGPAGARRIAFAPNVEHIGVLYSPASMREATTWLNRVFGRESSGYADARGPWVLLLIFSTVALGWPLARLLPLLADRPQGAGLHWRRFWAVALGPMLLTPVILVPLDLRFLPVAVGDYLATHFALYGVLTAVALRWTGGSAIWRGLKPPRAALWAAAAVAAYGILGIGGVVDWQVSSFWPTLQRLGLLLALLPGTVIYFAADEWLTRGPGAPRGAYAITKLCFLTSLGIAIALDLPRLFFLIIMAPAMLLFFIVFGLLSGWCRTETNHPAVGALSNALIFALAIAVTFPMLAG
jgi:dienelactone hydrolase